jgi:hypothetical protein
MFKKNKIALVIIDEKKVVILGPINLISQLQTPRRL